MRQIYYICCGYEPHKVIHHGHLDFKESQLLLLWTCQSLAYPRVKALKFEGIEGEKLRYTPSCRTPASFDDVKETALVSARNRALHLGRGGGGHKEEKKKKLKRITRGCS